ncbi:MAG TPA: hypothetical protein VFM25_03920 [Verrucomicrobiae bacterium]|nr:hypothetical protein [Verrucomicrobiae bacterium]
MNHAVKCKICKRPLVVRTDEECPLEWAQRLLPMATCNRCFDLRARRIAITEKLHNVCMELCTVRYFEKNGATPRTNQLRQKLKIALEKLCPAYMEVIAEYRGRKWDEPCDEFVALLMEKPDKLDACLRYVHKNF